MTFVTDMIVKDWEVPMATGAESDAAENGKSLGGGPNTRSESTNREGPVPSDAGPPADYIHDIRLMLDYSRQKGIVLPKEVLDRVDIAYHRAPAEPPLKPLIVLHGRLSQLVAPATPCSLAATTFDWKEKGARSTIVVIALMLAAAFLSMAGYLLTLPLGAAPAPSNIATPAAYATMLTGQSAKIMVSGEQVRLCLNYLFAAIAGSAFYSLLTAYSYLRKRTFDPSYLATYVIRFILGILAGVVLAGFGSKLIEGEETLSKLGPSVLALLGGYSAQAVKLILDRFVEVLVTTVKGRDGFSEERAAVATGLLSILQTATDNPNTPPEVKEKLDALLKKLQQ